MPGFDRNASNPVRVRRTLQRGVSGIAGSGLSTDPSSGTLAIDLRDGTPGLELSDTGLGVLVAAPLSIDAAGIELDLASAGGLFLTTAAPAGFLSIKLATNPGLVLATTGIKVKAGTGITVDANGVNVTAPEGVWTVTAVKTANYNAVIGELVRCNPTGGAFAVNLPAVSVANKGRSIVVKNQSASANAITVTPAGADTTDGAATTVIAAARLSLTFTSDGASDWMVT